MVAATNFSPAPKLAEVHKCTPESVYRTSLGKCFVCRECASEFHEHDLAGADQRLREHILRSCRAPWADLSLEQTESNDEDR